MSEEGKILSAKKDGVGTLTFSNPERLNAMSREMTRSAAEVMEDFTADPEVRVVIITGAGKKAFISGGDISKFEKARATPEQLVEYNKDSARFRVALRGSTATCASAPRIRSSACRQRAWVSATGPNRSASW